MQDWIRTFSGHSDQVVGCSFSPNGKTLVSVSEDMTVRLWDVETGVELMKFPTLGSASSVAVGVNGLIAVGDMNGMVYILRPHGIDLASNPPR